MNHWTQLSIDFANQRNYLDELYRVYPCEPEGLRDIDREIWSRVEYAFGQQNNPELIKALLELELFPLKDSYVAYLRRDQSAIERNPQTVNRLCGRLYELGLDDIYVRSSQPKETNRQIGPLFKRWVGSGAIGAPVLALEEFASSRDNAILDASDDGMRKFASESLGYQGDKGLDFIARFNERYIIGEAKFLTDYGGHQNAQFNDAINTLLSVSRDAVHIAILDGVLYIPNRGKMHRYITTQSNDRYIMSALVLREFLYSI